MRKQTLMWLSRVADEKETCSWCLGNYLTVDPESDTNQFCDRCQDGKVLRNPELYEILQELDYLQSEVKRLSDGMGP